ncbi:MAG: hypothetical protein QW035_01680 [Candidatus Anstonellales archaeon]
MKVSMQSGLAVFLLAFFGALIVLYPAATGLVLIVAIVVVGAVAGSMEKPEYKIFFLSVIVALSIISIFAHGMKFGIDFQGGTRIPITLEHKVDDTTMQEVITIIKKRASVMGLTEVRVTALGNAQVYVEIPGTNDERTTAILNSISKQGVFTGIVDGRVAISGREILPGTISRYVGNLPGGQNWAVYFSVTKEGAEHFAEVAKGKADYPLYMFIDREENATYIITKQDMANLSIEFKESEVMSALRKAIALEGDSSGILYVSSSAEVPAPEYQNRTAVASDASIAAALEAKGYKVKRVESMLPELFRNPTTGEIRVSKWEAAGLLSAPVLSPGVTEGLPSYSYQIGGQARDSAGALSFVEADAEARFVESILKGGSLPVRISVGSLISIPPSLGQSFLEISLIGIVGALLFVSVVIAVRYRKIKLIFPAVIVSISELIILLATLGSFTIDLAGMAGIIAAIGVGVDAQILITDELLRKGSSAKESLSRAFEIITMNTVVAVLVMVPLLFSGMVEVIGFAISTILGSLMGYLVSRPAYAALVEKIIGIE